MENMAVKMQGITKAFNGVKANDHVDFYLEKGSIHGLLGENGAGKTTLMNILYGLYQQDEGTIMINGKIEDISSPVKAISLGIGMVHQHFMLARPLTVVENVMLGRKSRRGILLDTKQTAQELAAVSDKYKMGVDPYSKIWQLSVGEQQRVEILTAIYMGAQTLILDEPTAVLTPQETELFFDTLREMREDGKSIILITHKLEEIVEIVDEVTVLRDGKMIGTKKMDPSVTKGELTNMMVGRDVLFNFPEITKQPGEVKLSFRNICVRNDKGLPALKDFSLDIRESEVVGLAGVDGNGQKELCEVLTGLRKADSGEMTLGGEPVINKEPIFFINKKVSYIPEDRHTTGLALDWSLKRNLIFKSIGKAPYSRNGLMQSKCINAYWEKAKDEYQIKAICGDEKARSLSGGNQQKIILAREIDVEPEVLIADQPTRGLDVGAAEYVRNKIIEARNNSAAVLVVSADLEEILQISDRIAVIYDGELMGILPRGADTYEIGELMMGKREEVAVSGK
ncbi:MAG: heme ABC transporter ATP-binding protein [Firmicutes bacterium HGW-Firmicutes-16]|nr:MAG: heme ABC transporter ATP-binding protein [Firmicutes bacterium HGW-Firmicutes-16]